ncbi:Tubulin polymerization-promoting protein member 3 [Globomyces sp. JEL0801]|nr:Tubulin polymerization-promoting protein member 3 [Globomyces sp. JEL0801]
MADLELLYGVYESFCQFGSTRTSNASLSSSLNNLKGPTMDGSKWAKFCRDCKVIDKVITPTEVDIVKSKTERKIDYDQFIEGLKMISAKKYSNKTTTESFVILVQFVLSTRGAPVNSVQMDVTNRLTDPQKYTGIHKEKSHGTMGSVYDLSDSGRESISTIKTTNGRRYSNFGQETSTKRGFNNVVTASTEYLDMNSNKTKKQEMYSSNTQLPKVNFGSKQNLTSSNSNLNQNGNVFDRLTNTQGYTGTHKQRFDEHGNGRGLEGREAIAKGSGTQSIYRGGNVNSLSQILRS